MAPERIDQRTLNRTTLHRQSLLQRSDQTPLDVISRLVGLQAQNPHDPYIGLWSRIVDFEPESVSDLMEARRVLRMVVLRGTIHLLTDEDAVVLRAYAQDVLEQEMRSHGEHKEHFKGVDLDAVIDYARPILTAAPLSPADLREVLEVEFPHCNSGALALACRNRLPLVQTPPRGLWQRSGGLRLMTLQGWIGRDCTPESTSRSKDIVRRYLGAFGPASPNDIVAWSRVPGLGKTMEAMSSTLRSYTSERAQQLLDLPDVELQSGATVSSPRFLPQYDNLLLAHRDRSRFGGEERRRMLADGSVVKGAVLIDGIVGARWSVSRDSASRQVAQQAATITVEHIDKLSKSDRQAIEAEASALARFLTPLSTRQDVVLTPLS